MAILRLMTPAATLEGSILQIVQICLDPHKKAVKERAAQRRFFLYCLVADTSERACEHVVGEFSQIRCSKAKKRIATCEWGGYVEKVEESVYQPVRGIRCSNCKTEI